MEQAEFRLPERPYPTITKEIDRMLEEVNLRLAFGRGAGRSRSKAGAGEEPRQTARRRPYVADTDREAIRRSTAKTSLLAQYYGVTPNTIRNIRGETEELSA